MDQERIGTPEGEEPNDSQNVDKFESDTQKVVRQHLEDKDHVISDEDIDNIRIGMTPPVDPKDKARIQILLYLFLLQKYCV